MTCPSITNFQSLYCNTSVTTCLSSFQYQDILNPQIIKGNVILKQFNSVYCELQKQIQGCNTEVIQRPSVVNLPSACIRKMAEEVQLLLYTLTCPHIHQKTLHDKLSHILHISHILQLSLPVNKHIMVLKQSTNNYRKLLPVTYN